jgi:outer membrane protein assembly factor BamD
MVLSYEQLGLHDLRDDAKRVLALNFPNAPAASSKAAKPWWKIW